LREWQVRPTGEATDSRTILRPEQLEALDALDRLNNDPRFALVMELRPGDLQLLNNHVILHSRTAYEDHPEPDLRRHLIRLWLDLTS
jgi:alpha-ketoglutarate-dependent taurine dioxygenase